MPPTTTVSAPKPLETSRFMGTFTQNDEGQPSCSDHGPLTKRISRTLLNPDRVFYKCLQSGCKVFVWANEIPATPASTNPQPPRLQPQQTQLGIREALLRTPPSTPSKRGREDDNLWTPATKRVNTGSSSARNRTAAQEKSRMRAINEGLEKRNDHSGTSTSGVQPLNALQIPDANSSEDEFDKLDQGFCYDRVDLGASYSSDTEVEKQITMILTPPATPASSSSSKGKQREEPIPGRVIESDPENPFEDRLTRSRKHDEDIKKAAGLMVRFGDVGKEVLRLGKGGKAVMDELESVKRENESYKKECESLKRTIERLERHLDAETKLNKILEDQIQELRGQNRVRQ